VARTRYRELPLSLRRLALLSIWSSVAALCLVVLVEGYELITARWATVGSVGIWLGAVGISAMYELVLARRSIRPMEYIRARLPDLLLLIIVVILAISGRLSEMALAVFVRQGLASLRILKSTERGDRFLMGLLARPAKLLASSFLILIVLGTTFLTFPRATVDGQGADLIDAAFTATSATCVTGLAVLNTNRDANSNPKLQSFTTFGQVVIFILIQIGGLGIMTLSASFVLLLGRRLGLRSQALLQDVMEEESRRDLERSIRYIVTMTFTVEAIGALILFFRFWPELGDARQALFYAIFHSVSAYCNAGFSLWSDSLTSFRSDPTVMFTIMGLITVGGLGFTVVAALIHRENLRQSPLATWVRFPVHVKTVLVVSLSLVIGGAIVYYFSEYHHSLAGLSLGEKLMASLFQSVTMRTAGFNTVDDSAMHRVTLMVMLLLMFIGGSSGSTAGGVKTTTVATVFLSVRAMVLGRDDVEVAGRTIPKNIVYKSVSILVIFVGLLVVFFLALLITEKEQEFHAVLFETVSALATVGVSTGITPELTPLGKLLVIFLMFVGRIGPLTLALAVGERAERTALRYPEGKIMVG
jgi:trk system potassium uptake protein TrkH